MATATRTEKDSIGTKEIPADVYYGIQTARAVENYPISGMRAHPTLIRAFGMVKEAAAEANKELGLVDEKSADAIIQAAKEVQQGKWDQEFVVDVFQAGAGVSFHMNSNEVIANRAVKILGGTLGDYSKVHPNDHVNYGQSTNDVFPTGMRLATLLGIGKALSGAGFAGSCAGEKRQRVSRDSEIRPHPYAGCCPHAAGTGIRGVCRRNSPGERRHPALPLNLCVNWGWAVRRLEPGSIRTRIIAKRRSGIWREFRDKS